MEKKWRKLIESLRRQEKQQEGKKEPDVSKLIILFLAGVFLLLLSLPTGNLSEKKDSTQKGTDKKQSQSTVQETAVSAMEEYAGKQERELEKVLSKVKGIGDVDVMVTIASSEEKRTLKQEDSSNSSTNESDSTGGSRTQKSLFYHKKTPCKTLENRLRTARKYGILDKAIIANSRRKGEGKPHDPHSSGGR